LAGQTAPAKNLSGRFSAEISKAKAAQTRHLSPIEMAA